MQLFNGTMFEVVYVIYYKEKTEAMQRSHPLGADYKLFEASEESP